MEQGSKERIWELKKHQWTFPKLKSKKKERQGKNDKIQGLLENDKAQSVLNENIEEKRKRRETERRMEGEKTHTDCHMAVAVSSFPIGQYCFFFPGILASIVRLLDSDKSELVSQRSCNLYTSLRARSTGNNRNKSPMLSMTGTKTQPQNPKVPSQNEYQTYTPKCVAF